MRALTRIKADAPVPATLTASAMHHHLHHRRLWSLDGLTRPDVLALLGAAGSLKRAAKEGHAPPLLRGKNLALLRDAPGSTGAGAFERAAASLGARLTRLRPSDSPVNDGRGLAETAHLLGRLYDAIDCEGMDADLIHAIDRHAGVPVYNGLGADNHPSGVLADLLTMAEHGRKRLDELSLCWVGDARGAHADAILPAAALSGLEQARVDNRMWVLQAMLVSTIG